MHTFSKGFTLATFASIVGGISPGDLAYSGIHPFIFIIGGISRLAYSRTRPFKINRYSNVSHLGHV